MILKIYKYKLFKNSKQDFRNDNKSSSITDLMLKVFYIETILKLLNLSLIFLNKCSDKKLGLM